MTKNLKMALSKEVVDGEVELIIYAAKDKNNDFSLAISSFVEKLQKEISIQKFKYSHPSSMVASLNDEELSHFVRVERGLEDWENERYIRSDLRELFVNHWDESKESLSWVSLSTTQTLFQAYKENVNPGTELTLEQFAQIIKNHPQLVDWEDTSHFRVNS